MIRLSPRWRKVFNDLWENKPRMILVVLAVNVVGSAVLGQPSMFVYSPLGVITWLVVVVVIAGLASLIPARSAARISVRESLAYE